MPGQPGDVVLSLAYILMISQFGCASLASLEEGMGRTVLETIRVESPSARRVGILCESVGTESV
jgi:hypothetical protein